MRTLARARRDDRAVERALQPWRHSRLLSAATAAVSTAGDAAIAALVVRRALDRQRPATLVAGMLAEQTVMAVVKRAARRDRPPPRYRPPMALSPRTSGFPSGHTSLGFFSAAATPPSPTSGVLCAAAALVALSRLHQGIHRPTDLAFGALHGALWGRGVRLVAGAGAPLLRDQRTHGKTRTLPEP